MTLIPDDDLEAKVRFILFWGRGHEADMPAELRNALAARIQTHF